MPKKPYHPAMQLHLPSTPLEYVVYGIVGIILVIVGYQVGHAWRGLTARKAIGEKEQELFTAQRGFKNLYEQELSQLKIQNQTLAEQVKTLTAKVEDYRKKAAGLGGLFNSGGKRGDAMYALLLENEALEEALYTQNEKLKQERTDALKEQLRSTSYRRVLMSQLLNDDRIKNYVHDIIDDDKRLPAPNVQSVQATPVQPADEPPRG
jgi:cell division protein FtsB